MDLHYLKIFNTVAKYLSYKEASEILHISQPALSIQIKRLESQIDQKLFYRIGNKIHLSDCGVMLYKYSKKIFAMVEEMESSILNQNGYIGGMINLGGSNTPGTYILPLAIGEMKKRYPSVTFNLHIANTSDITTLIENGTLDIALNGGNCSYSNHIHAEKLLDDKLIIVASVNNKCSIKDQIDIDDLARESFIVHETSSQLYTSFKYFIEKYEIPENIGMYLGNIDAIKQAVIADLGISIMPYCSVKAEIEMGLLKELNINLEEYKYPYNLIHNKNKELSCATQKFVEVLKELYSVE